MGVQARLRLMARSIPAEGERPPTATHRCQTGEQPMWSAPPGSLMSSDSQKETGSKLEPVFVQGNVISMRSEPFDETGGIDQEGELSSRPHLSRQRLRSNARRPQHFEPYLRHIKWNLLGHYVSVITYPASVIDKSNYFELLDHVLRQTRASLLRR